MSIEEKQGLIAYIANDCERCLIAPENPFTLDNPDLICANMNKLYALYILRYRESENVDHLLRRLYVSQLSYGYSLIPILLITKNIPQNVNFKVLENAFSFISYNVDNVLKFLKGVAPEVKRGKMFSELRNMQYISYRNRLDLSIQTYQGNPLKVEENRKALVKKVETRSWSTDIVRSSNNYYQAQDGFVGMAIKRKGSSFKNSLDSLMTTAFMSMFGFDDGIIYPTAIYEELSVLNTDWTMFDSDLIPNSYNRMLSFIGLAPVSFSSDDDYWRILECYQKIRNYVTR